MQKIRQMHQPCFLKFAISQDWVKKTFQHILKLIRFHRWSKQNSCVTKTSEVHLFFEFHIPVTVHTWWISCCWSEHVLFKLSISSRSSCSNSVDLDRSSFNWSCNWAMITFWVSYAANTSSASGISLPSLANEDKDESWYSKLTLARTVRSCIVSSRRRSSSSCKNRVAN